MALGPGNDSAASDQRLCQSTTGRSDADADRSLQEQAGHTIPTTSACEGCGDVAGTPAADDSRYAASRCSSSTDRISGSICRGSSAWTGAIWHLADRSPQTARPTTRTRLFIAFRPISRRCYMGYDSRARWAAGRRRHHRRFSGLHGEGVKIANVPFRVPPASAWSALL